MTFFYFRHFLDKLSVNRKRVKNISIKILNLLADKASD